MKKFIPENKPNINQELDKSISLNSEQQDFINNLNPRDAAAAFFSLIKNPKNVSEIARLASEIGFSENNMIFDGESGNAGDHISISKWAKAASGSLIVPIRYDAKGEIEILFGRKKDIEIWVLPGGHYELDDHKNLDHTLVAELMEETGIIPNNDKFLPYINMTFDHAKDMLPYKNIEEARENFVSDRFTCNLETVLSGGDLGYKKRIILAVYSIVFHDGEKLNPEPNDDLKKLKWFPLKEILSGSVKEDFSLSKLTPAQYKAVKHVLERMNLL